MYIVLVAAKGLISIDQQNALGLISIDHSHNVYKKDEALFEMLINGDEAFSRGQDDILLTVPTRSSRAMEHLSMVRPLLVIYPLLL
jgi:hypothetical protein